jgi:hypothetical protein
MSNDFDDMVMVPAALPAHLVEDDEFLRWLAGEFRQFCQKVADDEGISVQQAMKSTVMGGASDPENYNAVGLLLLALSRFPEEGDPFDIQTQHVGMAMGAGNGGLAPLGIVPPSKN